MPKLQPRTACPGRQHPRGNGGWPRRVGLSTSSASLTCAPPQGNTPSTAGPAPAPKRSGPASAACSTPSGPSEPSRSGRLGVGRDTAPLAHVGRKALLPTFRRWPRWLDIPRCAATTWRALSAGPTRRPPCPSGSSQRRGVLLYNNGGSNPALGIAMPERLAPPRIAVVGDVLTCLDVGVYGAARTRELQMTCQIKTTPGGANALRRIAASRHRATDLPIAAAPTTR